MKNYPEDRYQRDVVFRHLVDALEGLIREAKMTPTEIREAAILAAIHYVRTTSPTWYVKDGRLERVPE